MSVCSVTLPTTLRGGNRSRIVGRDRELAEVLARLEDGPLVTVVGAAGCGKTRLAAAVARQAAPRCADRAWFVDLTSVLLLLTRSPGQAHALREVLADTADAALLRRYLADVLRITEPASA